MGIVVLGDSLSIKSMNYPFEADLVGKESYKTALPAKSAMMSEPDANRALKELQSLQESLMDDNSDHHRNL